MQGMGRPSKGLIAFLACGHARTSRISSLSIARTAATLKKVEPRVGTRNAQREKRWFSTSASKAGSSTLAYVLHGFSDWECLGETDPAIQAAIRDNVPIKLSRGTA